MVRPLLLIQDCKVALDGDLSRFLHGGPENLTTRSASDPGELPLWRPGCSQHWMRRPADASTFVDSGHGGGRILHLHPLDGSSHLSSLSSHPKRDRNGFQDRFKGSSLQILRSLCDRSAFGGHHGQYPPAAPRSVLREHATSAREHHRPSIQGVASCSVQMFR